MRMLLGEGAKQDVDRLVRPFLTFAGTKPQNTICDSHNGVRRNNEKMIWFQYSAVRRGLNGERGLLRQDLCKEALVHWIEMLHKQKGHPCRGGEFRDQFGNGFQPPCGSADSDYQKGFIGRFHQLSIESRHSPFKSAQVRRRGNQDQKLSTFIKQ